LHPIHNLNGPALNIAGIDTHLLRVMAGPGTGKTFAMKRRVMRLVEQGADPNRILAVTFTRNPAASLVKELHGLGVHGCEDIHARTLHSFCFSVLGRRAVFEFLGRKARPLVTFSDHGVLQFEAAPMLHDIKNRVRSAVLETAPNGSARSKRLGQGFNRNLRAGHKIPSIISSTTLFWTGSAFMGLSSSANSCMKRFVFPQ